VTAFFAESLTQDQAIVPKAQEVGGVVGLRDGVHDA
jgi:hypothetical protein